MVHVENPGKGGDTSAADEEGLLVGYLHPACHSSPSVSRRGAVWVGTV